MTILVASRNRHKVEEISALMKPKGYDILGLNDIRNAPETVEDQPTMELNALKKAREAFQASGTLTMADDSGLEVYYLEMKPGIRSARYAGEGVTYEDNNRKLLRELRGVPPRKRFARFRTVIAIVGKGIEHLVEGTVEGKILESPVGTDGFGYDPLFVPAGHAKTYAQMTLEEKNGISHRSRALANAMQFLQTIRP